MKLKTSTISLLLKLTILWISILFLTWIITAITNGRLQRSYLNHFNDDVSIIIDTLENDYNHFLNDEVLSDNNWVYYEDSTSQIINSNVDTNIYITNYNDEQIIVLRKDNSNRVAYTNLEEFLNTNINLLDTHHIVLVDESSKYIYYDNLSILDNDLFTFYFNQRNRTLFTDYISSLDNGYISTMFNEQPYLIMFQKSLDGLIVLELVVFNDVIKVSRSILLLLIIISGTLGTLGIIIHTFIKRKEKEDDFNRSELSNHMRYNDKNIIIWVTSRGRIIDFNDKAKKVIDLLNKSVTIYELFNEPLNSFEVQIKNQISFNVSIGNITLEFKSLVQPHGYLLIGVEASEQSIIANKYRKAVYTNLVTKLPNHLSLFEDGMYLDAGQRPGLIAFGILDFNHISTALGKTYTKELLDEVSKYLFREIEGLPIKIYNTENDTFVILADSGINFNYEDWAIQIIGKANQIIHEKTNTKVQLNASILDIDHRNIKEGIESLYFTLVETLNRVKESPIYDILKYSEKLGIELSQDLVIEKDIKKAILEDEFNIHLQPIKSLVTNKLVSFEALLRWDHPTYSKMSPEKYLKFIRSSYLMNDLSDIIIRKVVETAVKLKPYDISITVNISANEILREGFIDHLLTLCATNDINPNMIGIEITENVLIHSVEIIRSKIKSLRKHGFKIYLDDFGTGFSSLSYLRYLKVDIIKIDRIFITDIETNDKSLEIYETIVKLIKRLGFRVVSEGVETLGQVQLLQNMGVEFTQGFLISSALPVGEVIGRIEDNKEF